MVSYDFYKGTFNSQIFWGDKLISEYFESKL